MKPSNILLVNNEQVSTVAKLSDFGLAKELSGTTQQPMTTGVGTQGWRAREVIMGRSTTKEDSDDSMDDSDDNMEDSDDSEDIIPDARAKGQLEAVRKQMNKTLREKNRI